MRHNGFLLEENRHAHANLPTERGVNRMMVVLRVLVVQSAVHNGWQYINVSLIWQASVSSSNQEMAIGPIKLALTVHQAYNTFAFHENLKGN